MFEYLNSWYRRYFTDPQAALLVVLLVLGFVIVLTMGQMLAPLIAAVIIAYLLEGPAQKIQKKISSRSLSVYIVFILFMTFLGYLLFFLLPILSRQMSQFLQEVPDMIGNGQELLLKLPQQYPDLISENAVREVIISIKSGVGDLGQDVLSVSLASIPAIISLLVYVILVPVMIFFFLKDKETIISWLTRFLPAERQLITEIWQEMDGQIGNYIRGKSNEIIIIFAASFILFRLMDLNYSTLLALAVGLSVLIPYIGAAVVTLPVALVAYFQWGLDGQFMWLMISYMILQFLDGNVLVPVLFSDAVNLHPIAIIVAILVFGGLWGFWGVFFAIPLATLVKALINIWPTTADYLHEASEGSGTVEV
jgi:putative permease